MDRIYLETKFATADDGTLEGLAWPFNVPDRIGDTIEPGAFKSTRLPLPMLFGHDQNEPLGTWTEATEDAEGLKLKGRLLVEDVARAREVRSLIRAGAVTGISIGFLTRKATSRKGGGRTITDLELLEASIVAIPMHPDARVTAAKDAIHALAIASAIQRATAQLQRK